MKLNISNLAQSRPKTMCIKYVYQSLNEYYINPKNFNALTMSILRPVNRFIHPEIETA